MVQNNPDEEYRLVAAVLCFAGHWRLQDKLGRKLSETHGPVPHYDPAVAKRVNRVFDHLKPAMPAYRINWSVVTRPDLFAPDPAPERRKTSDVDVTLYLRVERQSFVRLPKSNAIVFGIRTCISLLSGLSHEETQELAKSVAQHSESMREYKGGSDFFDVLKRRLSAHIDVGAPTK